MEIPEDIERFVLSLKGKGDAYVTIMDVEKLGDCFNLSVSMFIVCEGKGSLRKRPYHISYVPQNHELLMVYGFFIEVPADKLSTFEAAVATYAAKHVGQGFLVKAQGAFLSLLAYRRIDAGDAPQPAIEQICEAFTTLQEEWSAGVEHVYKALRLPGLGGSDKPH